MDYANVFDDVSFKDDPVNKKTCIKTEKLTADTYYFNPGQVLDYHRHPTGDQIFFVHEGEGVFYLDDGAEEKNILKSGVVVLAPKNVWHKIVNTGNKALIVSQATKQPAGMEKR